MFLDSAKIVSFPKLVEFQNLEPDANWSSNY